MGVNNNFGGWSIDEVCFNFIREILPSGKTILELGSGYGTKRLSEHYKMYSIENYPQWVGKYNSTYIHAPIKNYEEKTWWNDDTEHLPPEGMDPAEQKGWYDPDIVKKNLPKDYDLILVDGPNGTFGRGGFYKYLDWFKHDVPIIIDDMGRKAERDLAVLVSAKLNKPYKILSDGATGVIL